MKTRFISTVFALVGFLATTSSVLAASKKIDERSVAPVAALQAVSPDPLGGRLGLAASGARTETTPSATSAKRDLTAQSSRAIYDQRAYVIWKSSQKS